jgi:penicillin-binding protein 2
MNFLIKKRRNKGNLDPDEIFLDSKNLPNFNTQQFEGRLEKTIPKSSIFFLSFFFSFIALVFIGKLTFLQIVHGQDYLIKSENNILKREPIIAPRGLIYDRNEVLLAWNSWDNLDVDKLSPPQRKYYDLPGFGLLLGYVSPPAKDSAGYYWQDKFIGKDGVERFYNESLSGENGVRITETNVKGEIQSHNVVSKPVPGLNIKLTIDSRIQQKMHDSISMMAKNVGFQGGSGIIMDIKNGELLTLVSYPEYNSNVLSDGKESQVINSYFSDKRKVFLNRAVSGLYTPGSIVKPFVGYGALVENVISPLKQILSNGSISIPNPYFPDQKTVFKDHGVFGLVDMRKAIAVSSGVYFYQIGGGFQDQKGLGILKINDYMNMFKISQKTGIDLIGEKEGIIPNPEWKKKTFPGDIWRVGDTYNSSIGQYGFQVTPIQMTRATAGLASFGLIPVPHLNLEEKDVFEKQKIILPIDLENMKIIHEGMRMAVTEGTTGSLFIPELKVAAKSGTAQVGFGNTNTNSWIIGFFPYENPRYAFTVLLERGPKQASGNSTRVMREVLDYMVLNTPEYLE